MFANPLPDWHRVQMSSALRDERFHVEGYDGFSSSDHWQSRKLALFVGQGKAILGTSSGEPEPKTLF